MSIAARLRYYWFCNVKLPAYYRSMRPGRVVVDCGANVGDYTERFADTGATVYAFEPHPAAYELLLRRVGSRPNVVCINKAVGTCEGTLPLYLHPDSDGTEAKSECSSLMVEKRNISKSNFVHVSVISLSSFIKEIGHVHFLKMDIEGAEYEVLPDLVDSGSFALVDKIVVETHERSPGLASSHRALLAKLKVRRVRNIDLGWR